MLFIHLGLLAGLAAVVVPIAIHLWSQRRRQRVEWAAVRFLRRSVDVRKHKVELEDALLMATRCLLVALVAMAIARPFVPENSGVPWALVLPLGIAAICGLGVTVAVWRNKSLRLILLPLTLVALLLCGGLLILERQLNEKRLGAAGKQDIAIIIDASLSMTAGDNFGAAIKETRALAAGIDAGDPLAVILAGPAPEKLTPGLVRDRTSLDDKLGEARHSAGGMAALAAVETALDALADGNQPGKKIVMFTDAQVAGWHLDHRELWNALDEKLETFPVVPQLILRRFDFPKPFRNAAIAAIEFEPETVMVNQTGTITVVIENTGEQAITPNALEVEVDGVPLPDVPMDQIAPGERRPIPLPYRFREPGSVTVSARLVAEDDISADNEAAAVGYVRGTLQVLIVDGRPDDEALRKGATFLAFALDSALSQGSRQGVSIVPEMVGIEAFRERESLEGVGAIALCEVASLPRESAERVARYVNDGGGLIVAPGESANSVFYNSWLHKSGAVLPGELGERHRLSIIKDQLGPSPASFSKTAFGFLADETQSDIASMRVASYQTLAPREDGRPVGELRNGDPLFLIGALGEGKIFQSSIAFHPDASSLVTREVFLPIVHELVLDIAGDAELDLNLAPAAQLVLSLPTTERLGGKLPPDAQLVPASGDALRAKLRAELGGFSASWQWDDVPGLHDLQLPNEIAALLPPGLADMGGSLRFTVGRDVAESRKDLLTNEDLAAIGEYVELIETGSVGDVGSVLAGQPVGEELWRTLIIAALVLLVLESLLTRYITKQRKVGRAAAIKFGTAEAL